MNTKKTVVVGMSGGVDSSVAAYLLKKQGYNVIGVTMQIWQDEEVTTQEENGGCCGLTAVWDARRVAESLDIPYYVMNFKESFDKNVVEYFKREYLQGRTPNPCIACNRYVKWESLLKRSMEIGADYIATGHYARVIICDNGRYALKKSITDAKDQTYALYNLTQEQLSHTLMPVGEYEKSEVRKIAAEIGLGIADKPDSQEICFIPDNDYGKFLRENANNVPGEGNFVSAQGEVLGRHKGIYQYTVGQRKGLGIAFGHPVFVTEIRPDTNEVVLGENEDLLSTTLYANNINCMGAENFDKEQEYTIKIRYNHNGTSATVKKIVVSGQEYLECIMKQPQRAITPGQAVVIYRDDIVMGGGTILGSEYPS